MQQNISGFDGPLEGPLQAQAGASFLHVPVGHVQEEPGQGGHLASSQMGFLNYVVAPIYSIATAVCKDMQVVLQNIEDNRILWTVRAEREDTEKKERGGSV